MANPYPTPADPVSRGAYGDAVRWLQWHLQRMHLLVRKGTILPINGQYDYWTARAVKEYQHLKGLTETGTADKATIKTMGGVHDGLEQR